jgi:hypothetical protein
VQFANHLQQRLPSADEMLTHRAPVASIVSREHMIHEAGLASEWVADRFGVYRAVAARSLRRAVGTGATGLLRMSVCVGIGVMLLLALPFIPAPAAAQDDLPRPPCGVEPLPAYPADAASELAPMVVGAWQAAGGSPRWTPPACTGWTAAGEHGFRTLVAVVGRIHVARGGLDYLLARFGAVSMLRKTRYWSVSDGAWRPLASDASALDGPEPGRRRQDFDPAELRNGHEFYFVQHDGRTSGDVIYHLRVRESGPDRLIVQTENVTPIRLMVVTLFQPGALQAVYFLHRLSPTSWGYYSLSRTTEDGSNFLANGHKASYVNRAVALFRFVAGEPNDDASPLAGNK